MSSYEAIIAKIDRTEAIPGANKIQIGYVLGETVVVGKDTQAGEVGIFFPCDLQLSEDYCKFNNLYRDSAKNADDKQKGFFDDNRKVRAQKFMKVKSDGYFAPLDSLTYTGVKKDIFKIGDRITSLKLHPNSDPVEICKRYVSPKNQAGSGGGGKRGKAKPQAPMFREHVDTEQFKYNIDRIPVGALISLHAKVHGTSARYSNTLVKRQLLLMAFQDGMIRLKQIKPFGKLLKRVPDSVFEKIENVLGKLEWSKWELVAGTRRVLLQQHQRDKAGFNGPESFRFEWLDRLAPHISKGMTIYGEIAGWANGAPIMGKHSTAIVNDKAYTQKYGEEIIYKYGCVQGLSRFHIYRITVTTPDGFEVDLTDAQVHAWCESRGFLSPFVVHPPFIYDGNKEALLELITRLTERPEVLTEDYIDPSHVSEGIVIRIDYKNTVPKFLKNKSWVFKCLEGHFKEDNVDLEDAA